MGSNQCPTDNYLFSMLVSGTDLFAGTTNAAGVFRSADNGANWTAVNNGLTGNNVYCFAVADC
jgi:hypothetical protein